MSMLSVWFTKKSSKRTRWGSFHKLSGERACLEALDTYFFRVEGTLEWSDGRVDIPFRYLGQIPGRWIRRQVPWFVGLYSASMVLKIGSVFQAAPINRTFYHFGHKQGRNVKKGYERSAVEATSSESIMIASGLENLYLWTISLPRVPRGVFCRQQMFLSRKIRLPKD